MSSTGIDTVDIPVIDIAPTNHDAPKQLLDAATKYGFVFVENDEAIIPAKDIDQLFSLSREFFDSPTAEKEEVSISSNKAGRSR